MFGPEAKMAEKDQTTVELRGDGPDALEALLCYIYTSSYMEDLDKTIDLQYHLKVSETADSYLTKSWRSSLSQTFGVS